MYFEIENTPEHLKRARKKEIVSETITKEECPRLTLAPFCRPPQVVFDNVPIGTTCNKELEILNPLKHTQQLTLGKSMPPGLVIHLPDEGVEIKPGICYCLDIKWTPTQLTAIRETIHFNNNNRGRYEVIIVFKSIMSVKGRNNQTKSKISPGKIKKKTGKKSPIAVNKKKIEAICKTTTTKKNFNIVQSRLYKVAADKENESLTIKENTLSYDNTLDSNFRKCPFDSPTNLDFKSSDVFSNILQNKNSVLHQTYDKSCSIANNDKWVDSVPKNILTPSNNQDKYNITDTDIFDNLTFTPLKTDPIKKDKLDKGPKIILSVNSETDFDDSQDIKDSNKENESHSFICVTSSQQSNKWLSVNHVVQYDSNQCSNTPTITHKKIPNTSSPKDVNSPNFSINTEVSRISDLSFFPQRFSTERKMLPKINNETHEITDDSNVNVKVSSDTFTKESYTPRDFDVNQMVLEFKSLPFKQEQHPKICQKALFKEQPQHTEVFERNYLTRPEYYPWHNDLRVDVRSPPRSLTPPLQSIPEESLQFSDSQVLDKTDNYKHKTTFTVNRTFNKPKDPLSTRVNCKSWSKMAVRSENTQWIASASEEIKCSTRTASNKTKETSIIGKLDETSDINKNVNRNSYMNYIDNVYSQSLTVDPFLSSTYFYDKEAVEHIEKEFKRWLNWILTPPADLESNIEQKIDVGKAWIENGNKEVPIAPTKEKVCSLYHNSHRLESLRRSARNFLRSSEISEVSIKLNAQIDKKLISIRNDKNLHLDIGLQKMILEILLSYNPLWLRIGLEAIYSIILPLKSNSDIEGLTTFIIQRMFKNPYLKNKKSGAPNMLLPAYMEAIKKFTLKKFFILVFFLDKAKQKKLIPHDPCLFRRTAICKESREVVIRFTRELIAGIGDITKHLRPLGYVVSHQQSHLDEYIYAVHNVAVDVRDGVRLTKVMEIILMKSGLLHQLRTPAISRHRKIHNVQVALTALKEANFVIVGDITARDIVDGHREKTLSLLWQIIHVFRAPLFEKAANVIQTWWRKKYEVIVEKKNKERKQLLKLNTAASVIQYWWRRIQYNRLVEHEMYRITIATIVIQKYCRMWLCRRRLMKLKNSARKIAEWYRNIKMMHKAKETLQMLKLKRQELKIKSAIIIQKHIRRWLCMTRYRKIIMNVVLIQSLVKRYLTRKRYIRLKKSAIYIQEKYKSRLLMKKEVQILAKKKESAVRIQSYYRMYTQRKQYKNLKKSVLTLERFYYAIILMRRDRHYYLKLKQSTLKIQSSYRCKKMRSDYLRQRTLIINLQRKIRAYQAMKKCRLNFLNLCLTTIVIQKRVKAFLAMRVARTEFITLKKSTIVIQRYFRSYLSMRSQRTSFLLLKKSVTLIQIRYRCLIKMRHERASYLKLKSATVFIQGRYRALMLMRELKNNYLKLKQSVFLLQMRYRALLEMRKERLKYMKLKTSAIFIQNAFRAYLKGKRQRTLYLKQKESAIKIQKCFRCMKTKKAIKTIYEGRKKACATIQTYYKAYIAGKKQREHYLELKTATTVIQKYYKSYLLMKIIREQFLLMRSSTIVIQKFYRSWQETKKHKRTYLNIKQAVIVIQTYYRKYRVGKIIRHEFCQLKLATIFIQKRYRNLICMRKDRLLYLRMKHAATVIQKRYRAFQAMLIARQRYLELRSAVITIQIRYKASCLMQQDRYKYLRVLTACKTIQISYRAYKVGSEQQKKYLQLKKSTILLQRRHRALSLMREERQRYLNIQNATLAIQRRFRARQLMLQEKTAYRRIMISCLTIQRFYRARLDAIKHRQNFIQIKNAASVIQKRYREIREARKLRNEYIQLRAATIFIQRHIRARNLARERARKVAVDKIQTWYLSIKHRNECRTRFLDNKIKVIKLQTIFRMYIYRKRYISIKKATVTIQRFYRYLKLAKIEREKYVHNRRSVVKIQAYVRGFIQRRRYTRLRAAALVIQAVYRLKRRKATMATQRENAALCIQKNVRSYLAKSRFKRFIKRVIFVQRIWRGILITRLVRCEYLQKRELVLKLQALIRGYLARKNFERVKENLSKFKEDQRRNYAASKIQALYRGYKVRIASSDAVSKLCNRWRAGGLLSEQPTLRERYEEALEVLHHMSDIESVIRAFKSIELITQVCPSMFDNNASSVVRRIYVYMSVMNRSISSVEVLKSAASVLVNLTRYKITGPKIYARDRISSTLKFMWRFSSETQLICTLCTYIWLFSKYDDVRKDLTEYLRTPEIHKMVVAIKTNIYRMKRMANARIKTCHTPQPMKFASYTMNQSLRDSMNLSMHSTSTSCSYSLPALEFDYGIVRVGRPHCFEDAQQAITCLFDTYRL